jgi:hypothetical protein
VSVLTILPIQLLVKTLASIFWDRDWVAWAAVGFFSAWQALLTNLL